MLEVLAALSLFGFMLAGLFPIVVTQLRLVRKLETRFQGTVNYFPDHPDSKTGQTVVQMLPDDQPYHSLPARYPAQVYDLAPWNNPWLRRLSGCAMIRNRNDSDLAALNDFVPTEIPNSSPKALTIYDYQFGLDETTNDWIITVDLGAP
jgi:hypothetical protein